MHPRSEAFDRLSRSARYFLDTQSHHDAVPPVPRGRLAEHGVPAAVIDRMCAFQRDWGGLALPPAPAYDGGPIRFEAADLEQDGDDWTFEAGLPRSALPYGFVIGPGGEFCLSGPVLTPLHAGVEGWIEAQALAHEAFTWADTITRHRGDAAETVDLAGLEPVPETAGLADTWWRGDGLLVARFTGEARALDFPKGRRTIVFRGRFTP